MRAAIESSRFQAIPPGTSRVKTWTRIRSRVAYVRFSLGAAGHLADTSKHRVAELAHSAVELDDLLKFESLSEALT